MPHTAADGVQPDLAAAPQRVSVQDCREEPPEGTRKREGGALAAREVAHAGRLPTGPGDGAAAVLAREERAGTVLRLARDGWSLRAIAGRLDCSRETVRRILQDALSERASANALEAEQVRLLIADRLDASRRGLWSIAQGEPQPVGGREAARARQRGEPIACSVPTVAERIAAHRSMASIEEQRARLLGLQVQRSDGLDALARAMADLLQGPADAAAMDVANRLHRQEVAALSLEPDAPAPPAAERARTPEPTPTRAGEVE